MHTDGDECSADPILFCLHICILGVYLGMGVFRAESSDLSHMGVYTGMGLISVWPLLQANTVDYVQIMAVRSIIIKPICSSMVNF